MYYQTSCSNVMFYTAKWSNVVWIPVDLIQTQNLLLNFFFNRCYVASAHEGYTQVLHNQDHCLYQAIHRHVCVVCLDLCFMDSCKPAIDTELPTIEFFEWMLCTLYSQYTSCTESLNWPGVVDWTICYILYFLTH